MDPIYRGTVQVTDPLGTAQTYPYQGGDGIVRLQGASGAFQGGQVASEKLRRRDRCPKAKQTSWGCPRPTPGT